MKSHLINPVFAAFALFAGTIAAQPQTCAGVGNFHQLNGAVYRGAQPSAQGFQSLAHLGVKTIVDLRESGGRAVNEKKIVEAAGMKYINIPMDGHAAPTESQVVHLLALLNDNASGPVFVHCRRGADRTGTIMACYRISHDHWENQKALDEAKANGMSWTEMAMKHYVLGYKVNNETVATAAAVGTAQ
jgi:protein tyrosine/serine phosphatase